MSLVFCVSVPLHTCPPPLSQTHTHRGSLLFWRGVPLQLLAGSSALNLVAQGKGAQRAASVPRHAELCSLRMNPEPLFQGSALVISLLLPLSSELASCTYCVFKFLLRTRAHMVHSIFNSGPSVSQHKLTEFLLKAQALLGSLLTHAL